MDLLLGIVGLVAFSFGCGGRGVELFLAVSCELPEGTVYYCFHAGDFFIDFSVFLTD